MEKNGEFPINLFYNPFKYSRLTSHSSLSITETLVRRSSKFHKKNNTI